MISYYSDITISIVLPTYIIIVTICITVTVIILPSPITISAVKEFHLATHSESFQITLKLLTHFDFIWTNQVRYSKVMIDKGGFKLIKLENSPITI